MVNLKSFLSFFFLKGLLGNFFFFSFRKSFRIVDCFLQFLIFSKSFFFLESLFLRFVIGLGLNGAIIYSKIGKTITIYCVEGIVSYNF